MDEQTKEIYDMIYDMRERTIRIETQTERMGIIEKQSEKAKITANRAETKAENNKSNIASLWVFVSGIIIAVVTGYIKVIGG